MCAATGGYRLATTKTSLRRRLFASALVAGTFGLIAAAPAQEFYKGKTLTIVVGSSPGGGFDAVARRLAARIGDHIPGNPSVIVQNMPGAGSLTAVRYLDTTAPKDGTVITIFNPGLVTQSIVQPDKVKIDFTNFGWIGVVSPEFLVCYGFGRRGVRTWDDLMKRKQFILGATARGAGNYLTARALREVFNAPIKTIIGFPGSSDRRVAIERGELDGDCSAIDIIPADWLREDKAHIFVRFAEQRRDSMPESAAYVGSFATTDAQRELLDLLNTSDELGRPFIAPKQVPPDRLAQLRKAFEDTMKDDAFRAEMAKLGLPIVPVTAAQAEQIFRKLASSSSAIVTRARRIYE